MDFLVRPTPKPKSLVNDTLPPALLQYNANISINPFPRPGAGSARTDWFGRRLRSVGILYRRTPGARLTREALVALARLRK